MKTTTNSNITWNTFTNHPSHGVSIWQGGGNNIIHHNTFQDNNPGGTSQGADYSSNNVWYDIATSEGNWWNDWTEGDYPIAGDAGSVDPYPLGTPVTNGTPEFSTGSIFILVAIPCLFVVVIFHKKKK